MTSPNPESDMKQRIAFEIKETFCVTSGETVVIELDAENVVVGASVELKPLKSELTAAREEGRREGLEEAAKGFDYEYWTSVPVELEAPIRPFTIAAAIRARLQEGKSLGKTQG